MPLKSKDAEKLLGILWDVKMENLRVKEEDKEHPILQEEEHTLSKAISMLHCFVTDIAPSFHSSLPIPQDIYSDIIYDGALQVLNDEAQVQHIEFLCSTTRDPGLHFESFTNAISNTRVIYISYIDKGTVADRVEVFQRGDVVLEINGHSLARVSIERVRWLMKSAARTGKIVLSIVTCDGRYLPYHIRKKDFKSSQSIQQHLQSISSHPVRIDSGIRKIVDHEIHRRPSCTPSIGSRHSNHESLINTVEMAAKIAGRNSFRYSNKKLEGKNRQLVKAVLTKEDGSLGLRLTGGKGSKYGDIGIYICSVEEGKPAHKNGSFKKGDELLMINGKSVVGYKVADVVKLLKEAESSITIIVASKPIEEDLIGGISSISVESTNEMEVNKLLVDRENLDQLSQSVFDSIEKIASVPKKKRMNSSSAYDLSLKPHEKKKQRSRRASDQPPTKQIIELDELSIATLSNQPITQWGRLSTGNIHSSSLSKEKTRTIVFVKEKGGPPLGFSLSGGKGSKLGNKGIFVRSIQENGVAAKDGRLKVGDEIIVINEESTEGFTHKMAAEKIKNLKDVISLKVRTNKEYNHLVSKLEKHSSVKGTPINVKLTRSNTNEELGLVIAGLTDDRDEYGIFIKHIAPYSIADNCKLLHRADQIVSVNGNSLLDISVDEAMILISPNELIDLTVTIQVIRPKNVDALNKLLSYNTNDQYNSNWHGSFRMREREIPQNNIITDTPLTPLDHDILNLFATSEVELTDEGGSAQFLEETAMDFPSIANDLKDAQKKDGGQSILSSMTPILSRPSFAKQYSGNSSPSRSPKVSRVIEMKVKRQSGLITNEHTNQQETTFNVSDGDSSNHSWTSGTNPPDMLPPDMLPPDTSPPDTPPPDTSPPDTPPPDTPPPDALPPYIPPPNVHSLNIPPTDMSLLDMPTLNMLPPDSPPPDLPPLDMPNFDTSPYTSGMPSPSNLLFDMQPFVAKDIPPFGLDVVHLEIHKQKGKKGIGITLSGSISGQRDVYPTIKRLLHGSVGGKCGLIVGDKIGFINNDSTAGCTSQEVMSILIEAPKVFDIVVYRDPNMTSESTPSLSSVYGQSVTYTDSVSSLLSDEDSGIRRPSLPVQSSLTITSLQSSELTIDKNILNNIIKDNPLQYTTSSSLPLNVTPPQPTSPPPSPPRIDPPPQPTTPPPSPPIDLPPQPTTPPPSPPIDTPPQPTTPPPSPPIDPPPQPTTPPPSPPRIDPPARPATPPQSPPQPSTPPPSPPCQRSIRNTGPFTVQVMKGLFSLGLTVGKTEAGLFEVKAISSRSPLRKDGTLQVNDLLLSVNDNDVTGLTNTQLENILKSLPKGSVTITAMSPPRDVTEQRHTSSTNNDNEGIINVMLTRNPNSPLGIIVEGGSDTPLQNIYISSLKPGSSAFNCGQFQRGDQIVMCGEECLVGVTSVDAWDILSKTPQKVEFVLTRRKEIHPLLGTPIETTPTNNQPTTRPISIVGHKRRMSTYSLHFSSTTNDYNNDDNNIDDTTDDNTDTPPPSLSQTKFIDEHFTVILNRDINQRLGLGIHGGTDDPQLKGIYIKTIDSKGIAGITGRLHRGDRICSVNSHSFNNITRQEAINILKNTGCVVTIEIARQITRNSSQLGSKVSSLKGSADNTPPTNYPSSGSPSPVMRSGGGMRGKRTTSIIGRLGLAQTQGVKVVELHKGPTGIGMLLKGSRNKDSNVPITVKEVLPGGVAYKSNKITVGDELLEANSISFDGLAYTEAINVLKSLPQGTVRLTLLDKHFVAMTTSDP